MHDVFCLQMSYSRPHVKFLQRVCVMKPGVAYACQLWQAHSELKIVQRESYELFNHYVRLRRASPTALKQGTFTCAGMHSETYTCEQYYYKRASVSEMFGSISQAAVVQTVSVKKNMYVTKCI